jgi:hypothetical protein
MKFLSDLVKKIEEHNKWIMEEHLEVLYSRANDSIFDGWTRRQSAVKYNVLAGRYYKKYNTKYIPARRRE